MFVFLCEVYILVKNLFMKNHAFSIAALFLLLICNSCQKSTDLDYGYFSDWYLTNSTGTHEHGAKSVTVQTDGYFSCTKDTSIQVFFSGTIPPALGKYHIVSETNAANHTLGPNDVAVEFNVGISDVYLSIDGTDSASIVVTDKGFRHLYIPNIKVIHVNNGSVYDTATANGNISFPDH